MELPIIETVKRIGTVYKWLYGGVIITAIFTSAISAGYGFLSNCSKENEKKHKKIAMIICITSIFIAPIGFSTLVNIWYPFFGMLGLFQILTLLNSFDKIILRKSSVNGKKS